MFKTKATLSKALYMVGEELQRSNLTLNDSENLVRELQQELSSITAPEKFTKSAYLYELRKLYEQAKENFETPIALDLLDKIRELSK